MSRRTQITQQFMTDHRLSREEFADALQKGLGRAAVHVRSHGDAGVCAELLHACLHNVAYDEQIEGSRAAWLLGMIDGTEDPAFYREAILAKLAAYDGTDETWDPVQLCDFAMLYAQRGLAEAKPPIYRAHELAVQSSCSWLGYEEILTLDRLDGLDWLLRQTGRRILDGLDRYGADYSTVAHAQDMFGADEVNAHLKMRAAEDQAIAAFVAKHWFEDEASQSDEEPTQLTSRETRPSVRPRLPLLFDALDGPITDWELHPEYRTRALFFRLGSKAEPADIERVFERLLVEQDELRLLRQLCIFRRRALPRLAPRVFELTAHDDTAIAESARLALRHSRDPEVRRFGLQHLMNASTVHDLRWAVEMLENNFEQQDIELLLAKLPRHIVTDEDERYDLHELGSNLIDLPNAPTLPALEPVMLWLYESTPCSYCRHKAVRHLLTWNLLPAQFAAECRDDSAEDVRALFDEAPSTGVADD